MKVPATIPVRIAVAINAYGYHKSDDKVATEIVLEGLDGFCDVEAVHFVEAEIPVPVSQVIAGKVASA